MAGNRKLGELFWELRAQSEGLKRDLDDAERQFGKLSAFVLANPVAAIAGVSTALLGVAVSAAKMAETVERNLQKVSASTKGTADDIRGLSEVIANLSKASGISQAELSQAAVTSSKTAESVQATGERLAAALQLSVVSGNELGATLDSLDQVLDLFQISSSDAGKAVAELFTAARGKAPLAELFDGLKSVAPELNKLKIDLPTAARALLQFSDTTGVSGKGLKKAFAEFAAEGERGRQKILDLAAAVPTALNPVADLAKAFNDVNDNASNAAQRLREQFNAQLIALGTNILPAVNAGMQQLLRLFGADQTFNAKAIQNAVAELLAFGKETDGLFTAGVTGSKAAGSAVIQLADAVKNGTLSLKEFDRDALGALETRVRFFQDARYFDPEQLAQLRTLQREIQSARTALDAPSNGGKTGTNSGGLTQAELDALKKAEEEQAKALRDITQGFDDIIKKAALGTVSIEDFAKTVRELGDAFTDKVKQPTEAQITLFQKLSANARDAQLILQKINTAKAVDEFKKLEASLTPTVVDDLRIAYQELGKQVAAGLISGIIPPETATRILSLRQALDDAAIGAETFAQRIDGIKASAISSFDAQLGLIDLLHQTEDAFRELVTSDAALAGDKAAAIRINALREQIKKLKEEIDALGGTSSGKDPATDTAVQDAQRIGRAVEDVGRLTLTAAQAFHLLSDEATKALASTIDVGVGIGRIVAGDVKGGALQSASGLVSLLSQAFANDPNEAKREQEHQENIAALRAIEKHTGDLVGKNISGAALGSIQSALASFISAPVRSGPAAGFDISNNLAAVEAATGRSFKELVDLAKSFGVTLTLSKESFKDFLDVLRSLDFKAFAETVAGQLEALSDEFTLFPDKFAAGADKFAATIKILTDPKTGAPAIFGALAGIDVSTAEGAAQAVAILQGIFAKLKEGTLTAADLNGLNLDQVRELLKQLFGFIPDVFKTAGEKFADAVDAYGVAVEQGSLSAIDRLYRIKAKFAELFPDLFSQVDFSSAAKFKASIQTIIDGFAADGVLTEAEKAQITALLALVNAYNAAQTAATTFVDALTVLSEKFHLFGTDAIGQFTDLLDEFKNRFPQFAHLFDGLDVNTEEGRNAIRDKIRELFTQLAAGGVTDSEQAILDFLTQLFNAAVSATDQAVRDAQAAADAAAARRSQVFANAQAFIDIHNITDPIEILKIKLKALADAFPALSAQLSQFDVATQAGRDALRSFLQLFLADNPALLGPLASALGITVDQLRDFLLGLNVALNNTAAAVQTLAEKLQAAFDDANFTIALNGITDPLQQLIIKAQAAAKVLPQVAAALAGLDLTTAGGRAQATQNLVALGSTTTDPAVRQAIIDLLNGIRGIVDPALAGGGTSAQPIGPAPTTLQGSPTITAVQADRWLDLARTQLTVLREIAANTSRSATASFAARLDPASLLRAPTLPQNGNQTSGSGSGVVVLNYHATYNFGAVSPTDQAAVRKAIDSLSEGEARKLLELFARIQEKDNRARGNTSR